MKRIRTILEKLHLAAGDAFVIYAGAKQFATLGPGAVEVLKLYGGLFASAGRAVQSGTSGVTPFTDAEVADIQAQRRAADAKFRIMIANIPTANRGD